MLEYQNEQLRVTRHCRVFIVRKVIEMDHNCCILFGGQSSEHEVSCNSAANVIDRLRQSGLAPLCVGITKEGTWLLTEASTDALRNGTWQSDPTNRPAFILPDASIGGLLVLEKSGYRTAKLDWVFGVLHGRFGEDGTVQGLMELARIPYVGPDVMASALCMDKAYAKMVASWAGIDQTPWAYIRYHQYRTRREEELDRLERELHYPLFVKPANAGSSVGIRKVTDRASLAAAIEYAAPHDDKIVIEQGVQGREIECAVLGNEDPLASVCGEILAAGEFYDYDAKYNNPASRTVVPADIPQETHRAIGAIARQVYLLYGCSGLARVDFFLCPDGRILLNEVNTIPGFTSISMYPMMMQASGISYRELLLRLAELARARMEGGQKDG